MEQRHTFFLVPQNEDDSAIDKWDITDNDILDVLTSHGLKKESGTDIAIEWVLSSGIPHFAVKNVDKDNAKVLQGLCELEGIELASGHFVTVDNVIYGVGFTEIKDDKKDRKSKKDKKRGKSGKGTASEKAETDQAKLIAETLTDLIQAKNLNNLVEFCSHVNPSELRDSRTLRPAAVLALVYQLALCLPSSSGITDDDDNGSNTKTALAWLETFTSPSYIKGFGVKVLKVFCDVVAPVASKRIAFCPAPETITANVSSLVEMYSGLNLMDVSDLDMESMKH